MSKAHLHRHSTKQPFVGAEVEKLDIALSDTDAAGEFDEELCPQIAHQPAPQPPPPAPIKISQVAPNGGNEDEAHLREQIGGEEKGSSVKSKRKKAKRACLTCQKGHFTCGDERPCNRCKQRGWDDCRDGVGGRRGTRRKTCGEKYPRYDRTPSQANPTTTASRWIVPMPDLELFSSSSYTMHGVPGSPFSFPGSVL